MAVEWLPTGVGTVIGAGIAWFTGWSGRRHALKAASIERRQQRLADAYIELLDMLQHVGMWATSVAPFTDFGERKYELPTPDRQARVKALVRAYGSTALNELYNEYDETVRKIIMTDHRITMAMKHPDTGENEPGLRSKLGLELTPTERQLREKIEQQVANELRRDSK